MQGESTVFEDNQLHKTMLLWQSNKSNVIQTMNQTNLKTIISTQMYNDPHIVNESHCPQSPTRTLKALPNANVNTCTVSTTVTADNVYNLVQQLDAQQLIPQPQLQTCHASTSNLLSVVMQNTCTLTSHHQNFHEEQFRWKHIQCMTCHEVWPSRNRKDSHQCLRCTRDKSIPKKFSKANNMHPGSVPECLQNLTQVEEMLIARVSPIMYVYRKHGGQRGYKGHVLNLSQDIQSLLDKLPQDVSNLPILILRRTGCNDTFSNFTVRRQKVLTALIWLKQNNLFYKTIVIDYAVVQQLPENGVPDALLHDLSNKGELQGTCEYTPPRNNDHNECIEDESDTDSEMDCMNPQMVHETSCNESDGVIDHNSTSFISVPQQEQTEIEAIQNVIQEQNITPLPWPEMSRSPINEFTTEGLATMAFPTLFPYGTGDPTTKSRQCSISFSESFKHLISFGECINNKFVWRFATHPRFMYWALNMKQRHQGWLHNYKRGSELRSHLVNYRAV